MGMISQVNHIQAVLVQVSNTQQIKLMKRYTSAVFMGGSAQSRHVGTNFRGCHDVPRMMNPKRNPMADYSLAKGTRIHSCPIPYITFNKRSKNK